MLSNNGTNSNVVEIQQLQQQNNSMPSSEGSLEQKIELLGKEIKSLKKQNWLNSGIIGLGVIGLIGYVIAANWPVIAPALATAGTAIAAAAPVIGIVVGAIIGAAVLVGASYAAYKYRAQIKEGFKYAAEKTVDGAKYTAGKIRDGAAYVKGKTKEGASNVLRRSGNLLIETAHSGDYSIRGSQSVQDSLEKNGVKEIVNNLTGIINKDNSSVLSKIQSEVKSAIDSKIRELDSADKESNLEEKGNLKKQRKIVKRLKDVLTKKIVDTKDSDFIVKIFSENKDTIKDILDDYAQNPEKYPKSPKRMSGSMSSSSLSSLGEGSERSSSLSRSSSTSSLNSNSTDGSTAGLVNPEERKKAPTFKNKMSSLFRRNKAPKEAKEATEVKYQPLPGSGGKEPATVDPTRLRRNSSLFTSLNGSPVPVPDALSKAPESSTTSGCDSGRSSPLSSGNSTPQGQSLSQLGETDVQQHMAAQGVTPS